MTRAGAHPALLPDVVRLATDVDATGFTHHEIVARDETYLGGHEDRSRHYEMVASAITTTTALAASNLAADLFSIATVISLILLLAARELGGADAEGTRRSPRLRFFLGALNGPILALLAVFLVILAVKVWEVL